MNGRTFGEMQSRELHDAYHDYLLNEKGVQKVSLKIRCFLCRQIEKGDL